MTETTLYEKLLGIERPWRVRDVRLALEQGDVEVGVEFAGETLVCPACGAGCPGYDRRPREWRHIVRDWPPERPAVPRTATGVRAATTCTMEPLMGRRRGRPSQDIYAFDVGDFGKFGLLRHLMPALVARLFFPAVQGRGRQAFGPRPDPRGARSLDAVGGDIRTVEAGEELRLPRPSQFLFDIHRRLLKTTRSSQAIGQRG